jgi:hypothetical protein
MRLPELQLLLIDGARRREQTVQIRKPRLGGRKTLMAVLAVLLLGGTTAGAVITLSRSKPLTGTLAQGPSGSGPSHYRISVFPYMNVGWSGWCSSAVFNSHSSREATDYGCAPVESSGPVVAGGGSFGDQTADYSYGIVSDAVASVHWKGKLVQPISDPRLPPRTRAYFVVAPADYGRPERLPKLFDSNGHEIPQPLIFRANAVEHLPQIAVDPRNPGAAKCAVRASSVARLVPLTETLTTPAPWPRHQPGAFLACANATYRLDGTVLALAVLVDATDAERAAPPLPELRPDPSHPGLLTGHELGNIGFPQGLGVANLGGGRAFDTPTRHQEFANHDVTAKRAGPAWVIAEGGTPAQRATLLALVSTSRPFGLRPGVRPAARTVRRSPGPGTP